MKRFYIFLLLCFSLVFISYSSAQWIKQPVPVSRGIKGLKFIDSSKGWACTNSGSQLDTGYILHTTNGGTNWLIQQKFLSTEFFSMCIVDSLVGYVGGANSSGTEKIFKTTNGGTNWFDLNVIYNHRADDMFFVNRDSGYTCSPGAMFGDVRRTTNGGVNWVQYTGTLQGGDRLFFLNFNTGWLVASFWLYKTTNAGLNWNILSSFSNPGNSLFFLNESTGWIGSSGYVYYTMNGGVNFSTQYIPYSREIYDIYFSNLLIGYGGTGLQYIYKTTNSGQVWGYQIDSAGSTRISFIDSLRGWSTNYSNKIGHTTNGGGPITQITNSNEQIANDYKLYQNYPNPFNPLSSIKYQVLRSSNVKIIVYNITGKEILTLVNEKKFQGTYNVKFDGSNLSSGIYFYSLIVNGKFIDTKKSILLK